MLVKFKRHIHKNILNFSNKQYSHTSTSQFFTVRHNIQTRLVEISLAQHSGISEVRNTHTTSYQYNVCQQVLSIYHHSSYLYSIYQ